MKTRPALFIASLLIVAGITLNAQDGPPPGDEGGPPSGKRGKGPGMNMEKLTTELKLSEEQASKLKPVLEKVKSIFESNRPQGKPGSKSDSGQKRGSRKEMKKKMQEMQKKILAALEPAKEFLTDEQYKKLKEKFTKPPKGRPGKRPGNKKSDSDAFKGFDKSDKDDDL